MEIFTTKHAKDAKMKMYGGERFDRVDDAHVHSACTAMLRDQRQGRRGRFAGWDTRREAA